MYSMFQKSAKHIGFTHLALKTSSAMPVEWNNNTLRFSGRYFRIEYSMEYFLTEKMQNWSFGQNAVTEMPGNIL